VEDDTVGCSTLSVVLFFVVVLIEEEEEGWYGFLREVATPGKFNPVVNGIFFVGSATSTLSVFLFFVVVLIEEEEEEEGWYDMLMSGMDCVCRGNVDDDADDSDDDIARLNSNFFFRANASFLLFSISAI
jgi:hypothetical protein